MKKLVIATVAAAVLVGCSTASKDIASTYVSPLQYQSHDCEQLAAESQRIQMRANQVAGRLDQAASNDKAIMAGGVLFFFPALFALGGTKEQEAEYGRLKGEADAVQQTAIQKRCSSAVVAKPPAPAASAASAAAVAMAASAP